MKYQIKRDTTISEIAKKSPQAIELLADYGLSCATCYMNQFENIEDGAKLHGLNDDEIEKLINEINSLSA